MPGCETKISARLPLFVVAVAISFVANGNLCAQDVTSPLIKSSFIQKFAQYVVWPQEEAIDTFRIGIFGEEPELLSSILLLESFNLKGKPISIKKFDRLNDISRIQLLYITSESSSEIQKISKQIAGTHTLLVSDRARNQNLIMINFLPMTEGRVEFEVNQENITEAGMEIAPDLLFLGGTEIDMAELFTQSQQAVERFKGQIEELSESFKNKSKQIEEQNKQIEEQNQEIKNQWAEIEKRNSILKEQEDQIKSQEKKIDAQVSQLSNFANTIARQRIFLYIIIAICLLIVGLVFFIYNGYKIKKNANLEIEEKNRELENRQEEIILQSEKIRRANEKVIATNEDLELRKLELQYTLVNLKLAQAQLIQSEKMASVGVLSAGIAHELNNPINFVNGNVNPLRRDIKDLFSVIEKYEEIIEIDKLTDTFRDVDALKDKIDYSHLMKEIMGLLEGIEEGANRSSQIVKGLRSFSRLDEEKPQVYNIHEIIDSTLILLYNEIKNRIHIRKDYGDMKEIDCYPSKLKQVIMNILTNSIQAIEGKGEISIQTINGNKEIKIIIKDTGKGISPETKKHIFEPFFTTKDVGKGTGLGLSISFGIIEQHKGRIDVISEPGKGAEFIISLPKTQSK